jgi:hypothetical protein
MNNDPWSVNALNAELSSAINNLAFYHTEMQTYTNYYRYSAFYERQAGQKNDKLPDNYLKIFADKNIHYTSEMPQFKIAGTPEDRENANIREKILYAVHRKSGTPLLQKKWARDASKKSLAIAETGFDLDARCAWVKRYDPRYVYWKMSNGNEDRVTAFWAVFPITKEEAQKTYGVTPTSDPVSTSTYAKQDPYIGNMDGQKWFSMVIRWDSNYRTAWIGDVMIEEPHEHRMGIIPVDICAPFPTDEKDRLGSFYLEDLVPMQAELNDAIKRRSNITKRYSNPIIWGRGIKDRGKDDVEQALKNGESGLLGLGKDGEVGYLQLQELRILDNHIQELKSDMQRLSGFAAASFGESVGANTSGDALGMYFTPTQKHIDDQNISWIAFYESINAKILRLYDVFGMTGETFTLDGYSPRSTLMATENGGYAMNKSGDYKLKFTRDVINGNYINRAISCPVIPKNELAEWTFWNQAAKDKTISRTTAYEKMGLESPEDEKQLLIIEQQEPFLNPDGISSILSGMQQPAIPGAPGAPPALPAPPNLAAGVVRGS